jgi:hypothetical protein
MSATAQSPSPRARLQGKSRAPFKPVAVAKLSARANFNGREEPFLPHCGFAFGWCNACAPRRKPVEAKMHGLIYLIGLIVVIMAILSFFGLR